MKEIIKQAFADAEKEQQEKEIAEVKKIVKATLEKISEKSKRRDELDEEVKLLKKDIDDMKAGRLDRMKERQETDPKAREVSVIIIERIREVQPLKPWWSQYDFRWNGYVGLGSSNPTEMLTISGCSTTQNLAYSNITGTTAQNFVGGSYSLTNGSIINL